jgi:carbon starvation protein
MNSALIAVIGIGWLLLAYRLYGRFIASRVVKPDDSQTTPAHTMRDGVDYSPARPLVLFGHHFASIAGAGPIVGPVIAAAAFGFGASLLWILVGVVVIGAVHDYTTLMLSVRHEGKSIPDLTGRFVGPAARVLFQVFVWIALIFVIAVFVGAAKKTFIGEPRVVIPAFGLIPLAMVFGWLVNRVKLPLVLATVAALAALAGLFYLGMKVPISLPFSPEVSSQVWIAILLVYGAVAAVLPVWLLLQPRDYIGYWILAFGMAAGFVGLLVTHPPISAPVFTGMMSDKGPVWPMLFILVACGAVSGFHSLVSSGTTAKQLDRESHGLPVAFGAMLTEGGLALLALLAVTAGLAWAAPGEDAAGPTLQQFMAPGSANPIGAFAAGFGAFTEPFLGSIGALFGMTMINAFVLTTLDTSVRLSRFITSELAGPVVKPLRNRFLSTLIVVLAAYALAATGSVGTLWKMFGASNQLVAALAMLVVTAYLMQRGRPTVFTLIPAIFMLLTTCGALVWQGFSYLTADEPNYTLAVAAVVLLALAIFVGIRGFAAMRRGARVEP